MKIVHDLVGLRADQRGTVAVMAALLLPALIGAIGVGLEISNWYLDKRAMQNAADSAAIAAAFNGSSNYDVEAKAVAAQYGFVDGSKNVTVTASNTATCSAGDNTCYSVKITSLVPLFLSQVVGYKGDATLNDAPTKTLSSLAVAKQGIAPVKLCLLALGSSGKEGIHSNGAPFANLANCNAMSNTTSTCNGHDVNPDIGAAHGKNKGCGIKQYSDVPVVPDPYIGLASNIPNNLPATCSNTYPQDPQLPIGNQWSGFKLLSGTASVAGNTLVCGDLKLTGNVTIHTPTTGAVLFIENGRLDTNGYTLSTDNGSALTVVFSGTAGSYSHAPIGGGTIDITAPTSGNWHGVAIYQDPSLTSGVNISAAGNSPTWKITGLVYLPHSSVTFSGAVNKSSNGQSCFVLVADNVTVSGAGSILETGGCVAAGLSMPTALLPSRGELVL